MNLDTYHMSYGCWEWVPQMSDSYILTYEIRETFRTWKAKVPISILFTLVRM